MAAVKTPAEMRPMARSGPGFAYLMTGVAIGCICVSGVLGSIFTPNLVTGLQHEHFPIAAFTGWVFDLIAIGILVPAALQGIHAQVTDRAPWMMLGLGVGAIWLAVMAVSILSPTWVTGTDQTEIPIWSGLSAIAGVVLTGILCSFVKTASFQPVESKAGSVAMTPTEAQAPADGDPTVKLRRLAQLRDSGAISETEFQAKKTELLSRL